MRNTQNRDGTRIRTVHHKDEDHTPKQAHRVLGTAYSSHENSPAMTPPIVPVLAAGRSFPTINLSAMPLPLDASLPLPALPVPSSSSSSSSSSASPGHPRPPVESPSPPPGPLPRLTAFQAGSPPPPDAPP